MTNQYINLLDTGAEFSCQYDCYGEVSNYLINTDNRHTCIPKGNSNFNDITEYIIDNKLKIEPKLEWVQLVTNTDGELLHYKTNIGMFTDEHENPISMQIRDLIERELIKIIKTENEPWVKSIEFSVFLPRNHQLKDSNYKATESCAIDSSVLDLDFDIKARLIQSIEDNYFSENTHMQESLDYTKGVVFKFEANLKNIKKIFNWSLNAIEHEKPSLDASMSRELALSKRSRSSGPRTQWYFDWLTLQDYIWVPILHYSNRVIGMINMQAHRKDIPLMSRDRIGDMCCMKIRYSDGTESLQPISKLDDSQISIFPSELNWDYQPVDVAFNRIRFLFNQGLYLESLIVTQAILESIVGGMFDVQVVRDTFEREELRWEQKYKYLRSFIGSDLTPESHLKKLLDDGLREIYDYRNSCAHDFLEHLPSYDFDIDTYKHIQKLVKPFIEHHERSIFIRDVAFMYQKRNDFLTYLATQKKEE
ncbi:MULTISPECIES: hypothetical protein [Vibrio]|uniref:hypothetical protein n=1 Tax=Vibrio TaxID=662 RepID=UPI0002DAB107|nr:hypothetical protein [Vibrio tasmaniensis]OEF83997.1 hypothetical protein A162_11370 [Vibrio tasmaniensis 1F-155]PMO75794.1 hypothetical protein BCT01_16955 [Vibrio tasmaniensis]